MAIFAIGSITILVSRAQEPSRKVSLTRILEGSRATVAGNWTCSGCKSSNKPPQEPTSAQGHYQPATLRVAVSAMITPRVTIGLYEDLLKYVENELERRVELAQRRTYREVNDLVRRRLVDFAFVCSLSYVLGHDEFGMEILAVPEVNGKAQYYSYIIVRTDSKISDLEGLRGKTFAFMDPDSNTGWLYPAYRLAQMGESTDAFFSNYVYTYSHDNSIRAVAGQAVDGAAVDSLVFDHMIASNPGLAAQVKIIEKSPPFGIPPVVVHPALDSETKEQLRDILLNLHLDEKGRQALQKPHIDRFVRQNDRAYGWIREMYRTVQGQSRLESQE